MAKPNDKDYYSWEKIKAKLAKSLTKDGYPKRLMDENRAKELFRQAVRKRWMVSPQKLHYLESQRVPDLDYTRRKWKYQCKICGGWFCKEHVDVDHIEGEKSFTEWGQAFEYASSILDVGAKDLQLLCNGDSGVNCHRVKSTCERLGLDWRSEEGRQLAKFEIRFNDTVEKECKKAGDQRKWLEERGVTPEKNEPLRKQQIRKLLEEENEKD